MLEEYRRGYAEFNHAYLKEYYLFLSGQKTSLDIDRIYERYGELFTKDSIDRLKQALAETSEHFETDRAGTRRLLVFSIEQYLEASVKDLIREISEYESAATIRSSGREMAFQEAAAAISVESDRERRRALFKKRAEVIDSSNDLRAERLAKLHGAARSLGYSGYMTLFEELRGIDYRSIALESERFLDRTEALYVARLDEALRRDLGMRIEEAQRPDATYFTHLTGYNEHFPAEGLLNVYRNTMAGLGISVDSQSNIFIDDLPRPRKSARAFCIPVSVPDDVKLVIRPVGGQSDYQSLLHESGHAQHYGWTSPSLRPEFKYTGDYALTETYAFLFNHVVSDGAWLADLIHMGESSAFRRADMLSRLLLVRRYAAKLIYECELHTGDSPGQAADLYSELQTHATKFRTESTEFLYDLDDSFYSASYLRAWAFEVMLREHLKTRFGERWWASRRAGNLLKEMWETGDRYTADEMASQLGLGPIVFEPLIDEFNHSLS
jgi:hypothetical protein